MSYDTSICTCPTNRKDCPRHGESGLSNPPTRLSAEELQAIRERTEEAWDVTNANGTSGSPYTLSQHLEDVDALLADRDALEAELHEVREQRDMLQRTLETRAERELEMLEEVQKMVLDDFRSRLVAAVRADLDDDYSERVATFIEQFNAGEL